MSLANYRANIGDVDFVIDASTEKNGTYRVLNVATGNISRMGMNGLPPNLGGADRVVIIRAIDDTAEDALTNDPNQLTFQGYCNAN